MLFNSFVICSIFYAILVVFLKNSNGSKSIFITLQALQHGTQLFFVYPLSDNIRSIPQ
nr:MAG TPA: hypothetical protein [Bacteriophage sp.]